MTDKKVNERWLEFEKACDEHVARHGRNARIYISGPMTDRRTGKVSKENIEAFYNAEKRLRDAGNTCIVNPARVWACRWPWLYRIVGYRLTLWYDLQLLKHCDAIYLLNRWQDSVGAYEEFKLAFRRNLYVMTEQADINARFDILGFIGKKAKEAWNNSKKSESTLNGR